MAKRTASLRIAIEGEKEYKEALNQLNAGSKTLKSEMALLQAQYKNNGDSIEFLTEKSELLGRQLSQQQAKTAQTQALLEKAAEAYQKALEGVAAAQDKDTEAQKAAAQVLANADKALQKYTQDLNYAKAEEYNLQAEIDSTNEAINGQGQEFASLSDTVQDLAGKLGIRLPDGATKALEGMKGLSAGTVAAMGAAAAGIALVVKGVKALFDLTKSVSEDIDELITESQKTGIGTTVLQELQYAAPLIDVEVGTIEGSLVKLINNMDAARDGSESAASGFEKLGVSFQNDDLSLRNSMDVFYDVIDALGQVGNTTERDALANDIFGKSYQEINPLVVQGTKALQGYMAEASDLYVLNEDQIEVLGELSEQVDRNNLEWEGLKKQIAAQFAPAATSALKEFGNMVGASGKALVDSGIIKGVGEIVTMLFKMLSPITDLLTQADEVPGKLSPVYTVLHGIAGVLAWIADAANVVAGILTLDFDKIGTALGFGASSGNYSNMQTWMGMGDTTGQWQNPDTGLWEGNYGRNATGNDNWRGGLTWVGESGPELVSLPAGSQIASAQDSRNLGGDTYIFDINVDDLDDLQALISWAKSAKTRARMK